jgi:hypothetical protein
MERKRKLTKPRELLSSDFDQLIELVMSGMRSEGGARPATKHLRTASKRA